MNWKMVVTAMLGVVLIPSLLSCGPNSPIVNFPSGKKISYERFSIHDYYHKSERSAQIWVINSLQQYNRPQDIEWKPNPPDPQLSEPPPEINNFDFSEYFIIMVFNGFRGGRGDPMKIEGIRQDEDTVNIYVTFDDNLSTVNPVLSSQYGVLKIGREEMTQSGEITFTLIDQNGQERASATYNITN